VEALWKSRPGTLASESCFPPSRAPSGRRPEKPRCQMALHVGALGPRVKQPGCGDASACLDERIPVARRDRQGQHQSPCPLRTRDFAPKSSRGGAPRRPLWAARAAELGDSGEELKTLESGLWARET